VKQEMRFDDEHEFLIRLRELASSGAAARSIQVFSPVPVKEVDEILRARPTFVRLWAIVGAVTGCLCGAALTIYTVLNYPLITGGKPLISTMPFLIIAYALTILLGSLATFAGFLFLARLPNVPKILTPLDYGNQFVIVVETPDP